MKHLRRVLEGPLRPQSLNKCPRRPIVRPLPNLVRKESRALSPPSTVLLRCANPAVNRLSPSVIRGPHRGGGGLPCRVAVWPSAGPRLPRALPIAWFRPRIQETDIDLFAGGRENAARILRAFAASPLSGLRPPTRWTSDTFSAPCCPRDGSVSAPPSETLQAEYVRSGVGNPVKIARSSRRNGGETSAVRVRRPLRTFECTRSRGAQGRDGKRPARKSLKSQPLSPAARGR